MKTSRSLAALILLNGLACVVLATLWWSLHQQRRAVRDEGARQHDRAKRKIATRTAELRDVVRETEAAASRTRLAVERAAQPPPAAPADTFHAQRDSFVERLRTMPEYTGCLMRNARRSVIERYGPAIDALQLEPGQREQLVQLLADRELAMADASAILRVQGQDPNSAAAMKIPQQIQAESSAKLRSLLGESGYAAYLEETGFQQHRRLVLDDGNIALAEYGLPPLTEPQLRACFRAHSAAQQQVRRPQSRDEWAAAIRPQLATMISPAQAEVFIDHTYALARRTLIRVEISRQLRAGG